MNHPAFQIMLVSGNTGLRRVLSKLFQKDNLVFHPASGANEAMRFLQNHPLDLALVDLESLKSDGFKLLRQLKTRSSPFFMVVLALTVPKDTAGVLRAFELGVTDCVSRPYDGVFRARLRAHLETKFRHDELDRHNCDLSKARLAAETAAHAKSDFLAAMSHEIRTLMNGVVATVGLLSETPLTEEQRGYLETIHTGSESLLAIMNDILDFSKIEAGKWELDFQPFDPRACVEETLDLMSALAFEKNLDLVYQMDDDIPAVIEGDGLRLRQVLLNLLSNAIKFTQNGDVLVQVKLLSSKAEKDGNRSLLHLHFSVRDTGVGIPPDHLEQLFRPFTQAESSTAHHYGGTGLGLAISKRLVELMGGKMWAESVPGQGSVFHFTMNALAEPQAAPFTLAGRQDKLAGLHVLIVDDNAASLHTLAEQLTKWGMIPRSAANAKQALDFLRDGKSFNLALLDADMPGTDVFALAGKIRQLSGGRTPLVLLAPLGVPYDVPTTAHALFTAFMTKPVKPVQFFETLTRTLFNLKTTPGRTMSGADITQPAAPGPLRVLLCEDNVIGQKVAMRILQQLGYHPDLANNGREALEALDQRPYDLIFMDAMMPEMDGLEATRIIRERQRNGKNPNYHPHIVIVAMTARALQGDRKKCLAAGMDDYLAKPIRPKDVRGVIEHWSSKMAPPTPSPAAVAQPETATESAAEEPPVKMDRLMDLADGKPENVRELVDLYFSQTTRQIAQLEAAVQANKAEEVRQIAHSCAGASATLGMTRILPALRELERQGATGTLTNAGQFSADVAREFKRIQDFLSRHPSLAATTTTAKHS